MNQTDRTFQHRAFVAMVMVLSGLALPVTGFVNHFYGFDPPSVERHAWMSAHNSLGLLFVVFSIWHVVLNRRVLWNHVLSTATRIPAMSREAAIASAVVAGVLLLFVGHAFLAAAPRP